MTKMTKKEMYEDLICMLKTGASKSTMDEFVEFCAKEIEGLDKRATKAKERAEKRKAETDALKTKVFEFVPVEDYATREYIACAINETLDEDAEAVTVSKVGSRLTALFNDGLIEKKEVTVETDGKKRKIMGYKRIGDSDTFEDSDNID